MRTHQAWTFLMRMVIPGPAAGRRKGAFQIGSVT
jgi:hypothetical protein